MPEQRQMKNEQGLEEQNKISGSGRQYYTRDPACHFTEGTGKELLQCMVKQRETETCLEVKNRVLE